MLGIFAELGAKTVSADVIAREVLVQGSPAYNGVTRQFGEAVLTPGGDIDRAALGRIVFESPEARQAINDITHPRIIEELLCEIDTFRRNYPARGAILAVEIPLLVECGLKGIVDQVVLVIAEQETQIDRLTRDRGISRDEALLRIGAQMPVSQKMFHADRVIRNDGTPDSLREAVKVVWEEICLL